MWDKTASLYGKTNQDAKTTTWDKFHSCFESIYKKLNDAEDQIKHASQKLEKVYCFKNLTYSELLVCGDRNMTENEAAVLAFWVQGQSFNSSKANRGKPEFKKDIEELKRWQASRSFGPGVW